MSKYQELPQETLDGMSQQELNTYWKMMDDKAVRDKYARAALTGLLVGVEDMEATNGAINLAFIVADKCMVERDK